MKNNIFIALLAFILSACNVPMQSFIQTNNEGIFIQSKKNESIALYFNNPSNLNSNLKEKTIQKLQNLGFKIVSNNADYEIFINLIDFRKYSYAQRLNSQSARFFFNDFDKIDYVSEMDVENYYLMQANIQIKNNNFSQKTSLLARTAYLSDINRAKESLEEKISNQIAGFFYIK